MRLLFVLAALVALAPSLADAGPRPDRTPAELCSALDAKGFRKTRWALVTGVWGCTGQVEVGSGGRQGLATTLQFLAESSRPDEVQSFALSVSVFNPATRGVALARLRDVVEFFARAAMLEMPASLLSALEHPRPIGASTRTGSVMLDRVEMDVEHWRITFTWPSSGERAPENAK